MASRWRPFIDYTQPAEERAIKHHVHIQIHMLEFYLSNFGHAVTLMAHCQGLLAGVQPAALAAQSTANMRAHIDEKLKLTGWMQVASRDAVMTIYHFGSVLEALRSNAGKAASLRGFDSDGMKKAWKRFLKSFPLHEQFRHAVGHLADNMSTPEKLDALHPDEGALFSGVLTPDGYLIRQKDRNGRDNQMLLEITPETLAELEAIMVEAWEAFRPVSAFP